MYGGVDEHTIGGAANMQQKSELKDGITPSSFELWT